MSESSEFWGMGKWGRRFALVVGGGGFLAGTFAGLWSAVQLFGFTIGGWAP